MHLVIYLFFFFNDPATPEIYTLSLHDALPILVHQHRAGGVGDVGEVLAAVAPAGHVPDQPGVDGAHEQVTALGGLPRSEEHTSELQSRQYLVCRLLLEKKKKQLTHVNE